MLKGRYTLNQKTANTKRFDTLMACSILLHKCSELKQIIYQKKSRFSTWEPGAISSHMKSKSYHVLLLRVQMSGIIQPETSNYFNAIRNIICKTLATHPVNGLLKKKAGLSRPQSFKLIPFML